MQHTEHGKRTQTACHQIAPEESGCQKIEYQQHHLAGKTIHKEPAKRTDEQRRHGIARQHQTYHLLVCAVGVRQVQRQQRGQ